MKLHDGVALLLSPWISSPHSIFQIRNRSSQISLHLTHSQSHLLVVTSKSPQDPKPIVFHLFSVGNRSRPDPTIGSSSQPLNHRFSLSPPCVAIRQSPSGYTEIHYNKSADLVKMVSKLRDWPVFEILFEEVEKYKRKFQAFSLTHIPGTKNTKADKLARSARDQPYDVYYINSVPVVSLPEPL
ncbi:unnamed protein product [Microthlaspi erraticum]|uniref:RNase H type-1 domain-containing protein n=1 Tax=Microthlaspi erraticum TaxID=1685480 RepID=A0A6D2JP80_9BRAS|nr:unnamed protein product [Microthlaspi erraticum]